MHTAGQHIRHIHFVCCTSYSNMTRLYLCCRARVHTHTCSSSHSLLFTFCGAEIWMIPFFFLLIPVILFNGFMFTRGCNWTTAITKFGSIEVLLEMCGQYGLSLRYDIATYVRMKSIECWLHYRCFPFFIFFSIVVMWVRCNKLIWKRKE